MATRFSVWIDNPSVASDGNIQNYSTFANDSQRQNGFTAGTPASSIRMNTALRSATLVTTALMSALLPNSTLDASSSVADTAQGVLNGLKNVIADLIDESDIEQYVDYAGVVIADGDVMTQSSVAMALAMLAIEKDQNFLANGQHLRYETTVGNLKYYSCSYGDSTSWQYKNYSFDMTNYPTSITAHIYSGVIPSPTVSDVGKVLMVGPLGNYLLGSASSGGMVNPMTTPGDIIIGGSSGSPTRLGKGSAGQVLTMDSNGDSPMWSTPSSGGTTVIANPTLAGTEADLIGLQVGTTKYKVPSGGITVPGTASTLPKLPVVGTDGTTVYWENASENRNDGAGIVIRKPNGDIEVPATPSGNYSAASKKYVDEHVPSGVSYLTTAPSANNPDGDLKFVILSSEPATKYSGYLYLITGT